MGTALKHVLIVEPNETVRAEVRRLLSQARVAPPLISEASTIEAALDAYRSPEELRPAVIIFALALCGERGDEWLLAARGASAILSAPVILLGETDEDDRIDVALAAGAHDCLFLTNLNERTLLRTLEKVLSQHSRFRQSFEAEEHFRSMIESIPAMVWLSDTTKSRIFFNHAWLAFRNRTLDEERGFGWLAGLHPDDREPSLRIYSEAFDRRDEFQMEYRLTRHDGEYRWILSHGKPRYDSNGAFLGYIGSCVDITERKEAEEGLRLNEERLRVVLNGSSITVMTVDRELRYTWIHNPQLGFKAEQMIGKRDDELFPAELARPYLDFKREVLATEAPVHRELQFAWNGHLERYDTRGEPLRDAEGHVIGMTIVAINITDRVHNEQRSTFLANASQVLSSSLDYETTLQQVAKAMVPQLADWCSVDVLSEGNEIVQVAVAHVDPSKVQWARELRKHNPPNIDDPEGLPKVLRTGKPDFYPDIPQELIEEALRRAETEEIREVIRSVGFKSVMTVPMISRGQVLGAITFVWSDSDRHYNESDLAFAQELALRAGTAVDHARLYREAQVRAEEFRQLNETLEQLVDERTRELQRSNQDLDQFAYIASHDLKAPLRAIDHLSTWVLEDVGHLLPERSHEHLEKMRSRIKRMEGLLDDLLTYSRAGRIRGGATQVNLADLVARVIDTVSPPEGFTIKVEGELPDLITYAVPLETVLRNLVNNAIKHHDKPVGTVRISATETEEMVEFTVADDGPGIDPAFHNRIFQMFQTLRPRDQVEGSGIGLAVVDKIVTSMGGAIRVDSSPGRGATFHFTWPRVYNAQGASPV